jgi:uncharacterized SAM-binding protein YcdF (DUF218 family)
LHVNPVFVAIITQITAIVIILFSLALSLLMTIPSALLLPSSRMMPSPCNLYLTFASHHTPFIVLAVFQTQAL